MPLGYEKPTIRALRSSIHDKAYFNSLHQPLIEPPHLYASDPLIPIDEL